MLGNHIYVRQQTVIYVGYIGYIIYVGHTDIYVGYQVIYIGQQVVTQHI